MPLEKNYEIKEINVTDTYKVRHPVLRTNKPIDSCMFEGDTLKSTIHIGLFVKNKLVGVATFMKCNNPAFTVLEQYQLRGMAILKDYQGLKLGNAIITYGENMLKQKLTSLIWCNAREIAKKFYQRNGFSAVGEPFDIPKIGRHFVMFKTL
ncbi:GNAT family N-acetyltransferase [Flavobacteriaceae bacterium MHTCC 0001]